LEILDQPNFFWFWRISPNNYWKLNIPLFWASSSRFALDLRQYVMTNLAPKRRIVIALRPNLVITSVMIDLHMVVIQVHVGKNMVEDVLLDGRCCVNIMMEELWK